MAEFTELPIAAGPLVPRVIYNELLNAINNRRAVVLPDATAAFTIYNPSADADLATIEIDTAADEIQLIVVGGIHESNTTLPLDNVGFDTITELVTVINVIAGNWVAVEKSGAQSAHANNKSETLLSSGPADCLGEPHITWFTNYAPNGVLVNSLIGNIVAYRGAIDSLITGSRFYSEAGLIVNATNSLATTAVVDKSLSDAGVYTGLVLAGLKCRIAESTGGSTGIFTIVSNTDDKLIFTVSPGAGTDVRYSIDAIFTLDNLHNAAMGDDDWDTAGAPNLTPPCLPHKDLWNNMKSVLDLLVWIGAGEGPTTEVDASEYWLSPGTTDANWNTARSTSFANLIQQEMLNPETNLLGRHGTASKNGNYTVIRVAATLQQTDTQNTAIDYADLVATPTIVAGYIALEFSEFRPPTGNPEVFTAFDFDITIAGNTLTGGAYTVTPSYDEEWNAYSMDAAALAGINLDTANNVLLLDWASGLVTDDPGAGEWPAPGPGLNENWFQMLKITDWSLVLKHSWA